MEKRPLSLTIIGWLLIVLTVLGLVGVATMGRNPAAMNMLAQMRIPLALEQAWGVLGAIVNLLCAYGILKALPWARVLYLLWGIVGLVVGFYISPIKATVALALVLLVVIVAFLWTNSANDWFCARGFMLKRERQGEQPLSRRS